MSQNEGIGASSGVSCHCTTLRKASRRLSQYYDSILAESGLKTTQRAILAQLRRAGSLSVSHLAEALVMDRGGLAHTLKPLQRDGLISIDADPSDGRSRLVSLTPAGREKLGESDASWARAQQQFEQKLGKAEALTLQALLSRLVAAEFEQDNI
ncbi:MarR family winged helix-turn-helix transcriptional regulator [Klebsiella sp. WOUb02]|uniref:MarR family winged helix-turn-helix transcriptional regulator n=1 Tax=Klebsiella sp. WOUb02 TaxID=3161071 RepID=UPI003CEE0B8C